jgi:hypothetical protein
MNWIDWAVLIVCVLTALYGYRMGLFRMLVPLVVVVAGLALASRISGPVGNLFSSFTSNENTQTIMAFFVIFVALFLAGAVISFWLRMVFRFIPFFGLANGLTGAVAGLALAFVMLSGIITAAQRFPVGNIDQTINESPSALFFADRFGVVMRGLRLIPVDWDAKAQDVKDALPESIPTSLPNNVSDSLPAGLPRGISDLFPKKDLETQKAPGTQ